MDTPIYELGQMGRATWANIHYKPEDRHIEGKAGKPGKLFRLKLYQAV